MKKHWIIPYICNFGLIVLMMATILKLNARVNFLEQKFHIMEQSYIESSFDNNPILTDKPKLDIELRNY